MTRSDMWDVAVPTPLRRTFVYKVPKELGNPTVGARVFVSFGRRKVTGYLLGPNVEKPSGSFKIKNVIALLDEVPLLSEELIRFLGEAASYYMHPVGEVLRTALPPGIDYKERSGELIGPRIKHHIYEVARPRDKDSNKALAELKKRAPRRAEVLEKIVDAGEISVTDLKALNPQAKAHVKRLAQDELVVIEERERPPDPFIEQQVTGDKLPVLNPEQQIACRAIEDRLEHGGYKGFLLHGITGSGKTEVYLRAIAKARAMGRGALVLVPEISLTPQLVHRYRARFGNVLAVLHSGLKERERFDQWQLLRSGQVSVAIGVRSAVFAPIENLGIIIVDEEHDSSFKQEHGFRYSARDLALLRAARAGAVAVLGSATPSLESHHNADTKKLTRLSLTVRATDQPLPEVSVIDLKRHRSGPNGQSVVTQPLFEAVNETLDRKEQVILFLNRRGFAPAMLCTGCGELSKCDACAVSLTFHNRPPRLICHYCGAKRPVPDRCPSCSSTELKPVGAGTQKAEDLLNVLFPRARIARMDRDSASGIKGEAVLDKLRRREIDILVGTQMVTKGHDFPFVTLVGVLNADVGLHMPDFRAAERTFQLLTQVAGRAGRSSRGGRAMIQTYSAGHPSIHLAQTHDYVTFAKTETEFRKELGYPPFGRLTALRLSSQDETKVEAAGRDLFTALMNIQNKTRKKEVTMLGPVPAPLSLVQGRYRWRILLSAPRQDQIRRLLEPAISRIESPPSGVRISIDIDPVSML
ncbi:MAG: primosomal protein N' [Proteobacteria bacterium]|nr:primosomal protein N' [Pseudomonadota bacterium]